VHPICCGLDVHSVVQIAAIKITVNHLLDILLPESLLTGEMFFMNLDAGLLGAFFTTISMNK